MRPFLQQVPLVRFHVHRDSSVAAPGLRPRFVCVGGGVVVVVVASVVVLSQSTRNSRLVRRRAHSK